MKPAIPYASVSQVDVIPLGRYFTRMVVTDNVTVIVTAMQQWQSKFGRRTLFAGIKTSPQGMIAMKHQIVDLWDGFVGVRWPLLIVIVNTNKNNIKTIEMLFLF